MRGNAYFEALAAMPEATVKIYNKVNPLKSYKSMGRLHDKYIVIDRQNYILGGRNTFNYFLGDNEGHKNYDRDVLVYCAKTDENSSVNQLIMTACGTIRRARLFYQAVRLLIKKR